MLSMSVVMTIRTGRSAAHSAAWFAWVPATGLAQHHPPPEVACELAHFLWKWHRLIEIGYKLTIVRFSCHLDSSLHHVFSILSRSHVQVSDQDESPSRKSSLFQLPLLDETPLYVACSLLLSPMRKAADVVYIERMKVCEYGIGVMGRREQRERRQSTPRSCSP